MPMCSVKSCGNASKKKTVDKSIKYFSFPREPDICEEWIKATGKDNLNVKNARICSTHFEASCFKEDWRKELYGSEYVPKSGARLIKPDAVPTLNLRHLQSDEPELQYIEVEVLEELGKLSGAREPLKTRNTENVPQDLIIEIPVKTSVEIANERLLEEVARLKRELENSKKEIEDHQKFLQIHNAQLKKAVQDSQQSFIELLTNVFTPGQIKQLLNPNLKHVKWSDEDISSAISLRNVSPEAYEYLRNKRKMPLPGTSTLRRWVADSDFNEGILKSVMTHMNMKNKEMTELEKLVILSFDDIHLSNKIEVDKQRTKAVTVMARGLFGKWKTPIYYEYNKSMTTLTLLQIIDCLHSNGFTVVAIVSDIGPTTTCMWQELNIDSENRCYFLHPSDEESKIFVFADVPQLLKLLRNHFLDSGFLWNKKNVTKECIEQVLNTTDTDLDLEHKVTQYHLNVKGIERRTVRPAAQLLSNTIAMAVEYLGERGHMDDLDWEETATCIRTINDWFDIFNSQESDGQPNPHEYGVDIQKQNAILKRMSTLTQGMRVGQQDALLPFQQAILLNNHSLPQLFQYLRKQYDSETETVKYLQTRRLNLDVMKQFFAHIISMGATNNQPGASDFKYRLRWYILGRNPASRFINNTAEEPNCDETESALETDRVFTNDFHSLYTKRKFAHNQEDEDSPHNADDNLNFDQSKQKKNKRRNMK